MNRLFTRGGRGNICEKKDEIIISVIGIGQGVGASTVATVLAYCFAKKGEVVTYLEGVDTSKCSRLLYNQVAMDKRFINRQFNDFYELISNDKLIKGKYNYEEQIYWMIATPLDLSEKISLTQAQKYRMLLHGKGTKIIDIDDGSGWEEFLKESDAIIAVVDPLPSKMITNVSSYKKIKQLELQGMKVKWVVNKMNKGVNKHQVREYIKSSNVVWIDTIPDEKIYSDEFACRFHWNNVEFCDQIMGIFTELSQYL